MTAGWGFVSSGAVMPGKGKLAARDYTPAEKDVMEDGLQTLGMTLQQGLALWGTTTYDVHLNDIAY